VQGSVAAPTPGQQTTVGFNKQRQWSKFQIAMAYPREGCVLKVPRGRVCIRKVGETGKGSVVGWGAQVVKLCGKGIG